MKIRRMLAGVATIAVTAFAAVSCTVPPPASDGGSWTCTTVPSLDPHLAPSQTCERVG